MKKFNIDFQGGGYGGHLGFPIRIILAIFALHVPLILSMKFPVNWPFLREKKFKIEHGGYGDHLEFLIFIFFSLFFYLQVTLLLPIKFRVNWVFPFMRRSSK